MDDTKIPNEDLPEPEILTVKPRIRQAKPLVEGINSPVRVSNAGKPAAHHKTSNLTENEKRHINTPVVKQSIHEPKPMSQFMPAKPKSHGRAFSILVVGLILVGLVWGATMWYKNRQTVLEESKVVSGSSDQASSPAPAPSPESSVQASSTTTTSSTSAQVSPSPASEPVSQLKIKETPTGFLNVRSEPSTAGALVTKINPGEVYTYMNAKAGWYEIKLSDGKTGWVTGQYIEKVPSK